MTSMIKGSARSGTKSKNRPIDVRPRPDYRSGMEEAVLLEVEGLSHGFGDQRVLSEIDLRIAPGEIVALIGANGAGKTTLLRLIAGLLRPWRGVLRFGGRLLEGASVEARRAMAYLPEGPPLYEEMRVREFLDFRASLKGIPRHQRSKRVDGVLEQSAVGQVQTRIIGQLSRGFRQRVGIADALLGQPRLVLLDEPGSGLDPLQLEAMYALFRSLSSSTAFLLSSHHLRELEIFCDRVLLLHGGRKVGEFAPNAFVGDARSEEGTSPFARRCLDEMRRAMVLEESKG